MNRSPLATRCHIAFAIILCALIYSILPAFIHIHPIYQLNINRPHSYPALITHCADDEYLIDDACIHPDTLNTYDAIRFFNYYNTMHPDAY